MARGCPERTTSPPAGCRIGFVYRRGLFWTFFHYHLLNQAKRFGLQLLSRPVANLDAQLNEMAWLLDAGIDVLLFHPMAAVDVQLLPLLRRAQSAGVHLISLDGSPGGHLELNTVTANNTAGQAEVSEHVFSQLGGRGKVAYLQCDIDSESGMLRNQGFHSVLARFPGIELVYEASYDWSLPTSNHAQACEMAERILDVHPDIDAILSATDEGAIGVISVLKARGLSGKVLVAGFDGMPEALLALSDGSLTVTARQPLEAMANKAIELALDQLRGEATVVTHAVLDVDLVTRAALGTAALRALRVFPEITADINRQVIAENQTAAFLEALLDHMPSMLCVKDARTLRSLRRNKAYEQWMKAPHGALPESGGDDDSPSWLTGRADTEMERKEDYAILAGGQTIDRQLEIDVAGVGKRYLRTRKIPIFGAGKQAFCLMCIADDVTPQIVAQQVQSKHAAELEQAHQVLTSTHQKLVQTEKMAALGVLVAGIAHEINTPVGNALLAVTTFVDHTRSLVAQQTTGLRRSTLEAYLADADSSISLTLRNLQRAAELIESFKHVAVDQHSSSRRHFSLARLVADTVQTLSAQLKKAGVAIEQEIDPEIFLDSFPGPLEQVLMNLINNAITHGFANRHNGLIRVAATLTGKQIELLVEDNGAGINADVIKRIFDPFFSTRFGKGSSGLGLSIVGNIVSSLLEGQIDVDSTPGQGARFCLTLPVRTETGHD